MAKYEIDTLRHSLAHLMAQAVTRVFPNEKIQFGVGPVIEHGFYYDIDMEHSLTDEDLKRIEKKMKELIKEALPIERKVMSRDQAIEFFDQQGQNLKVELIRDIPEDEDISCYSQGEFIDLCRGPHVENTKELPPFFRLQHTAGAYWRGDSDKRMLQRLYAVSFNNKAALKQHLNFLEEAKKRDHRKLGKELELFHFEQVAPASPFFMPKGAVIYNELIEFVRRLYRAFDYKEVITPQIIDSELWKTSGHYEHYEENMYFSQIDEREYAVKPMNCPCHMLMYKHYKYSYRDLPLRYADFGRLHRYEKAGAVAGLTRVRTFCQDDAHVFLTMDDIQNEIQQLLKMFFMCYRHFGFEKVRVNLSTRPEKKAGDDATWDQAEAALKEALDNSEHDYHIKEGDGAFYGPKIDIEIADALGRYYQLGTIQMDFQLPQRFGLTFTNAQSEEEQPVVIHRALLGSLERFFGIYLEHTAGVFPFWLAPVQIVIVPVSTEHHTSACHELKKQLMTKGLRVEVDERNETIGYKTRQIQKQKVPFMLVMGERERDNKTVNIRAYGEKAGQTITQEELHQKVDELMQETLPSELR